MRIVRPTVEHAALLARLGAETFADTFVGMQYYTQEIVDGYNAQTFTPEKIGAELARPEICYFLLEVDGEWAGYAKLEERASPPCLADRRAIYLQRIYLTKAFHRRGLGSQLLTAVYAEARARGYEWLWLSVWEYNVPAVEFYRKQGYTQAGDWEWAFEWNGTRYVDRDWVMTARIPG